MFQQKRNKQFNYKSRLSNDGAFSSEKTVSDNQASKIALFKRPVRKSKATRLPYLLIVLVIIIVVMYYLERKAS